MWAHSNDSVIFEQIDDRLRVSEELAEMCELPPGSDPEHCFRGECSYFDARLRRCGLMMWSVPFRLGPDAVRWFVAHRAFSPSADGLDESLDARCSSL